MWLPLITFIRTWLAGSSTNQSRRPTFPKAPLKNVPVQPIQVFVCGSVVGLHGKALWSEISSEIFQIGVQRKSTRTFATSWDWAVDVKLSVNVHTWEPTLMEGSRITGRSTDALVAPSGVDSTVPLFVISVAMWTVLMVGTFPMKPQLFFSNYSNY